MAKALGLFHDQRRFLTFLTGFEGLAYRRPIYRTMKVSLIPVLIARVRKVRKLWQRDSSEFPPTVRNHPTVRSAFLPSCRDRMAAPSHWQPENCHDTHAPSPAIATAWPLLRGPSRASESRQCFPTHQTRPDTGQGQRQRQEQPRRCSRRAVPSSIELGAGGWPKYPAEINV
jgi:hypothetical protein